MEGNDTIAAVGSGGSVNVIATRGVGLIVPSVTIASGNRLFCVLRWVDSQVESYDVIATVSSNSGVNIVAACSVGLAVPSVAIACYYSFLCVLSWVDCKVEDVLDTINVGSLVCFIVRVLTSGNKC